MTTQEVSQMVESIGLPYAYYQFEADPKNPAPAPPFICFFYPSSDDFIADDLNYQTIWPLAVELYTDNKDFALEHRVASALRDHDLNYQKEETWLDDEHMYMITFNTEVCITNGTWSE